MALFHILSADEAPGSMGVMSPEDMKVALSIAWAFADLNPTLGVWLMDDLGRIRAANHEDFEAQFRNTDA